MSYICFDVTIEDRIAHLKMKRPEKRNSMIPEFWDELPQIVEEEWAHSLTVAAPDGYRIKFFSRRVPAGTGTA